MKCVLVLSLVALCYAEVPTTPTPPSVSFGEDGTIIVTEADGKKVVISNSIGNVGRRNVDISAPDSFGTTRTIKVNQDYNVRTINIDDPNSPLYGAKQPVPELYQGLLNYGDSPFWYKGINGASLQEYRDFYGQQQKNQLISVQDAQKYLQQKWQPLYEPYQQQVSQPLQQLTQPQQQWTLSQSLWSLPKQQLAQEQDTFLWNQRQQQLTEARQMIQPQQLRSQQMLTQPRDQLNFVLPERQLVQEFSWNQAQKPQPYYGQQQQYYEPQQQYYGPQQQYYDSQQQYYEPQQQYYGYQQERIDSQGNQLVNQVYPKSQQITNEHLWTMPDQQIAQEKQLEQEQQGFLSSRGQQIQSNIPLGNYWQRLWVPQMRQM